MTTQGDNKHAMLDMYEGRGLEVDTLQYRHATDPIPCPVEDSGLHTVVSSPSMSFEEAKKFDALYGGLHSVSSTTFHEARNVDGYHGGLQSGGLPNTVGPHSTSFQDTKKFDTFTLELPERPADPQRRILGLRVPVFWALVIAIALIIAGGALGGGLAARNHQGGGDSIAAAATTSSPSTSGQPAVLQTTVTQLSDVAAATATQAGSLPLPPGGDSSSTPPSSRTATDATTNRATPTPTQSVPSSAVSPAPVDLPPGCPAVDRTVYTPLGANGAPIPVTSAAQSFRVLCNTVFPSEGSTGGNAGLVDLWRTYVPSMADCVRVCAEWNRELAASGKAKSGGKPTAGDWCRGVALHKSLAGSCWLKNSGDMTLRNYTTKPADFVSAVLVSGDVPKG